MRKLGVIIALLLVPNTADAQYYKYSDWAAEDASSRNMYVSGAADALARSERINQCLGATLKMKAGQLTMNVLAFAAGRPALHSRSMAEVIYAYLREACPKSQ